MSIKIAPTWHAALIAEFEQPYFTALTAFLREAKAAGKVIYPPGNLIFNAFDTTPFEAVKVVILGQDPYHGAGQAMGLSFSVPDGVKLPPSLRNVYKELATDVGVVPSQSGNLTAWAAQGVFLLNASLTVEAGQANSHQKIGWHSFTDAVIQQLSARREGLVFMLWGGFAKAKKSLIDPEKHLILESAHPSPLAGNAFLGNHHFSQANAYLVANGQSPINWTI
jgi:uracil-DNA glycosylase